MTFVLHFQGSGNIQSICIFTEIYSISPIASTIDTKVIHIHSWYDITVFSRWFIARWLRQKTRISKSIIMTFIFFYIIVKAIIINVIGKAYSLGSANIYVREVYILYCEFWCWCYINLYCIIIGIILMRWSFIQRPTIICFYMNKPLT